MKHTVASPNPPTLGRTLPHLKPSSESQGAYDRGLCSWVSLGWGHWGRWAFSILKNEGLRVRISNPHFRLK